MHFSRMRTARSLTVSRSIFWGSVYLLGVYLLGGVHAWGVSVQVLPPVNRMTDRCKYITLPKTSFAGGNNKTFYPDYMLTFQRILGRV